MNSPIVTSISFMANQPDINKRQITVRVSREYYRRVERLAAERKMNVIDYLRWLIWKETDRIPLTKEDYDIIEREKKQALRKRQSGN